ncbi:MAG: DUF11 domain-containing protein, partial [Gammaproteobacteria bacterium]
AQSSAATFSFAPNGALVLTENQDTFGGNFNAANGYIGDIAEIITYDTTLAAGEQRRVETYLALKYGLTLEGDYVRGDGTVIFDAAAAGEFVAGIAGIGQDGTVLLQPRSRSTTAGSLVTIGNAADQQDGEFLIWSSDGTGVTPMTAGGRVVERARRWRVTETGDVGAVDVSFSTADLAITPQAGQGYLLLVADDSALTSNLQTIDLGSTPGVLTAPGVDVGDGQYFAVAVEVPVVDIDLAVTNVADVNNVIQGDTVTYTVTVANNGPGPATNVRAVVAVPPVLTYVPASIAGAEARDDTDPVGAGLVWTTGGISAGGQIALTFQVTVNAEAGGTITTSAAVTLDQTDTNATVDDPDEDIVVQTYPGGVSTGLHLWLKADAGTDASVDGADVASWLDHSGGANNASAAGSTGTAPTLETAELNFNPVVRFTDDGGRHLRSTLNPPSDDLSLIAVFRTTQRDGTGRHWSSPALIGGQRSGRETDYSLGLSGGQSHFKALNVSGLGTRSGSDEADGVAHLAVGARALGGMADLFIDGRLAGSSASDAVQLTGPGALGIGNHFNPTGGGQFEGDIAEAIVYETALGPAERERIESYLAIKYGLTLDQSAPRNYVDTRGNVIFDAAAAAGFSSDIAGVGRDDRTLQNQVLSRSVNPGSVVTIGNPSDLQSSEFLIWGHNGAATNTTTSALIDGRVLERIDRIWWVAETGEVGGVDIEIDSTDLSALSLDPGESYRLLVADDAAFTTNVQILDLGAAPGVLTASAADVNDAQYFTFGVESPTGDSDLVIAKTADNARPLEGGTVTWTITLTNNGPAGVTNVAVTDPLPAGLSYVPASIAGGDSRSDVDPAGAGLTWNVAGLGAGASAALTFQAGVPANSSGRAFTNTVSGVTLDQTDTNATVDDPSEQITVQAYPGAVQAGLQLWLKADAGTSTTTDMEALDSWRDQSESDTVLANTGVGQPTFLDNATDNVNFNPVVGFDGVDDVLTADIVDFTAEHSVFFVAKTPPGQGSFDALFANSRSGAAINFRTAGGRYRYAGAINIDGGVVDDMPVIVGFTSVGTADPLVSLYHNGVQEGQGNLGALNSGQVFTHYILGANRNVNSFLETDVAEAIVYSRALPAAEQARVESYLALKYGITLDQTAPRNYVDADGNVIYDAAASSGFTSDVAGIGEDRLTSLSQRRSRSIDADSLVTIGNPADLQDGEFLLWGNNDAALSTTTSLVAAGRVFEHVDRIWRVDATGDVGGIDVEVDSTGLTGLTLAPGQRYRLLIADDAAFTTSLQVVDMGTTPGALTAAGATLGDNQFFTFAVESPVSDSDIVLIKSVDNATPSEGSTVIYTINVINNGPGDVTNVVVTDAVPAGVSYVPASIAGGDARDDANPSGGLTWSLNRLALGGTAVLSLRVVVDAGTSGTAIVNTASVALDQNDTNVTADDPEARIGVGSGPGGVNTSLQLWLKADAGVTGTTAVGQWADQSPNGNNAAQANTARLPALIDNAVNFNPALRFDGTADFLDVPFNTALNPAQVTIFSVHVLNGGTGFRSVLTSRSTGPARGYTLYAIDGDSYSLWTGRGATGWDQSNDGPVGSSFEIVSMDATAGIGTASKRLRVNGELRVNDVNRRYDPAIANSYRIGSGQSERVNGRDFWPGDIAEQIVYNSVLTDADVARVESYLALKYGITLDQTTPRNYVDSAGNTVYDAAAAAGFDNDIAGIGEDNLAGLSQPRSKSINAGSVVSIGAAADLQSGEFLVWGNDGGALNTASPVTVAGQLLMRVTRTWRVTETGDVGEFAMDVASADLPGLTPQPGDGYVLLVADDAAMASNARIVALGGTSALTATNITIDDGQFFTFATGAPLVTDLQIGMTVDNTAPAEGDAVTYTITVANNGPAPASNIVITDPAPAGLSYIGGSISGGDLRDETDPAGAGLAWTINALAVNTSATLSF